MIIKSLDKISIEVITKSFNQAFANYFVKFNATPEYLQNRWLQARVNYSLSIGAFEGDELIGFMVHGVDNYHENKQTAFNVGTGVVPKYRGQRLVKQMYDYALPILKNNGIQQCGLEVIQENTVAIKAYESVGFSKYRSYLGFKGSFIPKDMVTSNKVTIKELSKIDWEQVSNWWLTSPSWEYLPQAMMHHTTLLKLGIFESNQLVGYAVLHPTSGSIFQFAIHPNHRRKGLATLLFQKIKSITPNIQIINVDSNNDSVLDFIKSIQLGTGINQFEMMLIVK